MNNRKILISVLFVILVIILVSVFWKLPLILSILLIIAAVFKSRIIPIKKELLWFCISGLIGPGVESLIMLSGAWKYAQNSLVNFPVWLILLWGLAGTLGMSLYEGLTLKNENNYNKFKSQKH